jgi:predicted solute-binding protein
MIHLGMTNDLISLPLTMHLASTTNSGVTIKEQSLHKNYIDLLKKKLDAAFIAPSDYAKDSSILKLVKDIAIYSKGEGHYSIIFFQENLIDIEEVGYQGVSHYKDLAFLLFNEFFEIDPEWKPIKAGVSLEASLRTHQAVLQNGDEALENYGRVDNRIDVIDQWWDKTGLSFIHQVFAVRRDLKETNWIDAIYQSRDKGMTSLKQISEAYGKYHNCSPQFYHNLLNNCFYYSPKEDTWKECIEYLNYLYYYGKLPFIPEFHFV